MYDIGDSNFSNISWKLAFLKPGLQLCSNYFNHSSIINITLMKYTIVILVSTTTHWLRLSREDRNQYTITHIGPILAKYAPTVTLRMFDAEAFNARHTDFLIVETTD